MIRPVLAVLLALFSASAAVAQTDPAMVPIPLYAAANAPPDVDPLTQFAADTNLRFIDGAQARALLTTQIAALIPRTTALEGRAVALEAKSDLTPRVVALEARLIVPDLTSRVTTLEACPLLTD